MSGEGPQGTTPLDPDEAEELIPGHITTRAELDAWEQANITEALPWITRRRPAEELLTLRVLLELHRRMLGHTWKWAGSFRHSLKSLGVPPEQIAPNLGDLLEDVRYWMEHRTWDSDGIAIRFHHRLVAIHPFANGNGRHARLMTDALLRSLGAEPFTWGAVSRGPAEGTRQRYLDALRAADRGDYEPLGRFART